MAWLQISKVGMMAPKDVRPLLSAMAADSLISLQEVPKSADRNPARTFFLWSVAFVCFKMKALLIVLAGMSTSRKRTPSSWEICTKHCTIS